MIGTYYRLSLADEDVGADKAESNSIQGQRGLVEGYIMARPELATEPRQHPAWQAGVEWHDGGKHHEK